MPGRSRPTARLLTPAGWAGLLVLALLGFGAMVMLGVLPRV